MKRRTFIAAVGAMATRKRGAESAEPATPIDSNTGERSEKVEAPGSDGVVNVRNAPFNAKGDGVTDDTRAFTAAKKASATLYVPPGIYKLSHFDGSNLTLRGAGRGATAIIGDGDLVTNAVNLSLADVTLHNNRTRGKLVSLAPGPDAARSSFNDVAFGAATHHVYADRVCVDWVFRDCTFNDSSDASRHFKSAWAFKEFACYSWYNLIGLRITGGGTLASFGCVYEFNRAQAVILSAIKGGTINNVLFDGTHFESNGSLGHTESVRLETVAAERIRNVAFRSCTFMDLKGPQHVHVSAGAGGNVARISFRDVFSSDSLINPGVAPTFDNVEMNTGEPPPDALIVEALLDRIRRLPS